MSNGMQISGQVQQPMRSDISSVLEQMRAMREAAGAELDIEMRGADAADKPAQTSSFGLLMKSALDSVSELQTDAGAKTDAFVRGETTDLVSVMIATQKSSVAFQALTQVRNRMVSAYQDIMNMPI